MFIETLRDYVDYLNTFPSFFQGDISFLEFLKATIIYGSHAFKDGVIYIFTFAWLRDFIEIPLLLRHTYTCIENQELVSKTGGDVLMKLADEGANIGFFSAVDLEKFYSSHFGTGFFNSFFLCCPMTVSHFLTIRALLVNGFPAALSSGLGLLFGQLSFIICVLLGFERFLMPWLNMHEIVIIAGVLILISAIKDLNEDLGWEQPLEICPPHAHLLQKLFRTTLTLSWCEQVCIFSCLGNINTVGTSTALEIAGGNFWVGTLTYVMGLAAGYFTWGVVWALVISRVRWFVIGSSYLEVNFIHNAFMAMALAFSLASFPYYGSEYFTGKVLGFLPGDPYMAWAQPQTTRFYYPVDHFATGQINKRFTSVTIPNYDLMVKELIEEQEKTLLDEPDPSKSHKEQRESARDREDELREMGFVAPYQSKCSPTPPDEPIESVLCDSEINYINSEHHRNPPEDQFRGDLLMEYREKPDNGYKDGLIFPTFFEDAERIAYDIKHEIQTLKEEINLLEYRQQLELESEDDVPSEPAYYNPRNEKKKIPLVLNNKADFNELLKNSRDRAFMKRLKAKNPNAPLPSLETRKQVFIKQLEIIKNAYPGFDNDGTNQSYIDRLQTFTTVPSVKRYVEKTAEFYDHKEYELGNKAECQLAFREKFYANPLYNFLLKLEMFPFSLGQSREEALDPDEEALLFAHRAAVQNYANSISFFKTKRGPGGFARQVSNQQFKGTLNVIRMFRFAQVHEVQPLGPLPPAQNQNEESEKKSFFRSLFGKFRKKANKNPEQTVDSQIVTQLDKQNLGDNEQIQPGELKTDQQTETQQVEQQKPNDKNPVWTHSKAGLKHKVLKYDQPLPQRIEDQENFAFHEELELEEVEPSKDPLMHYDMVDQSVPMYIGWDGNLRKFLVKTYVSPYKVYTSDQLYTDPKAIYKDADLESTDLESTDLESTEKVKAQNEILSYYSFQSWSKSAKRVKRGRDTDAVAHFPVARYTKQQTSDIKKILLGHILTDAHIQNENRIFKKDLQQLHKEATKKVEKIMKNLPNYDWWERTSSEIDQNLEMAIDIDSKADELEKGKKKYDATGKLDLGTMDAPYILHMSKVKPSDKININRNEKINYQKPEQLDNIDRNLKRIYTGYFNLGSSTPPGMYGLAWPGVRDPGYFRYPLHGWSNRKATQHLLNETVEDLKKKNKQLNVPKQPENLYTFTPYTKKPVKVPDIKKEN